MYIFTLSPQPPPFAPFSPFAAFPYFLPFAVPFRSLSFPYFRPLLFSVPIFAASYFRPFVPPPKFAVFFVCLIICGGANFAAKFAKFTPCKTML